MTFLRLAPDVYVASVSGDLVFMDARRNRYSCLPASGAADLQPLLSAGRVDVRNGLTEELQEAGLLEAGDEPSCLPCDCRCNAAFSDFAAETLRPGPRSWLRAFAAWIEGLFQLHVLPPARWLRPRRRTGSVPLTRVCSLALQFDRVRPWLPRTGRCLPNSLVLRSYLARHGIGVQLVFGVRTCPFEAHCWLEHEGVVLNDTAEHVGWFTPIAAG